MSACSSSLRHSSSSPTDTTHTMASPTPSEAPVPQKQAQDPSPINLHRLLELPIDILYQVRHFVYSIFRC